MKRTFIAIKIPLSKQKQEIISDIQFKLKDEKIKWVDTWNMHITLFFLGDTDDDFIPVISDRIVELLQGIKSFSLKLNGLGLFKSLHDPKVMWIGINPSDKLKELKTLVDQVIVPLGFEKDTREFKPHLTLGRIKYMKDKENLKRIIDQNKEYDFGEILIDQLNFYESTLTSKGPIYKIIKQVKLN